MFTAQLFQSTTAKKTTPLNTQDSTLENNKSNAEQKAGSINPQTQSMTDVITTNTIRLADINLARLQREGTHIADTSANTRTENTENTENTEKNSRELALTASGEWIRVDGQLLSISANSSQVDESEYAHVDNPHEQTDSTPLTDKELKENRSKPHEKPSHGISEIIKKWQSNGALPINTSLLNACIVASLAAISIYIALNK